MGPRLVVVWTVPFSTVVYGVLVNRGQFAPLVESSQQRGTGGNFCSPQACSPSLAVLEEQHCVQLGEFYGSLCFVCGSVFPFACMKWWGGGSDGVKLRPTASGMLGWYKSSLKPHIPSLAISGACPWCCYSLPQSGLRTR